MAKSSRWEEEIRKQAEIAERDYKRLKQMRRVMMVLTLAATTVGTVAAATSMEALIRQWIEPQKERSLPEKIKALTGSLSQSANIITEIESEIKERQGLVEKLQQDAKAAERLAKINRDQAEAVALMVREEIVRQDKSNFWISNLINLGYVVLGIVLGDIYQRLKRMWQRTKAQAQ